MGAALARTQEEPSSQKEEKGGKFKAVEETQASSPEEMPSPVRKNSMSQTDRPSVSSGGFQTERRAFLDAGAQADLATPGADASEEIAEVISEYDERIGQMQELHAAEIMDMEARHISESEALKGEALLLQQECQTLKVVIEKLRTAEVSCPMGFRCWPTSNCRLIRSLPYPLYCSLQVCLISARAARPLAEQR